MVVTTLLFLITSTSAICLRRFADVPAGSDVTDFRCLMCTSAEPEKLSELFCAVLCTTVVHTYEQFLKMSVGLRLGLVLCICLGLAFCLFFSGLV